MMNRDYCMGAAAAREGGTMGKLKLEWAVGGFKTLDYKGRVVWNNRPWYQSSELKKVHTTRSVVPT